MEDLQCEDICNALGKLTDVLQGIEKSLEEKNRNDEELIEWVSVLADELQKNRSVLAAIKLR